MLHIEHPNLLLNPQIKGLPVLMIHSKTNMKTMDLCIGDVQLLCLGHKSKWSNSSRRDELYGVYVGLYTSVYWLHEELFATVQEL